MTRAALLRLLPTLLAAAVLAVAPGCERGEREPEPAPFTRTSPQVHFGRADGVITTAQDTHRITLEVAERDDQRSFGLMDRDELAEDHGMVFLYEQQQPGDAGYWMYRTRIPLDIAFFDGSGRIVSILQMEPCGSPDPNVCRQMARGYAPGVAYFGALEMNRGWFARRGVAVGDRIAVIR